MWGSIRTKIAATIALIAGLAAVGLGYQQYSEEKLLEVEGKSVQGKVIGRRAESGRKGRMTYKLNVEYQTKAGDPPFQREFKVSKDAYEAGFEGAAIDVRYLPSKPDTSTIQGANSGMETLIMGAIATVIGAGLWFFQLRKKPDPAAAAS